jgi:hypothetical protein
LFVGEHERSTNGEGGLRNVIATVFDGPKILAMDALASVHKINDRTELHVSVQQAIVTIIRAFTQVYVKSVSNMAVNFCDETFNPRIVAAST